MGRHLSLAGWLGLALGLDLVPKGEREVEGAICERPGSRRLAWLKLLVDAYTSSLR